MNSEELKDLIEGGESSFVQFKKRINNAYAAGKEMVAFANSGGGKIIIGIEDKTGSISGLSFDEIEQTNNLIANAADNNINPSIYIETDNVKIDNKWIIVATVKEALSKPVIDNKGIIWVKNGSDKRKVTAQNELRRLFQKSNELFADEQPVKGTTLNNINRDYLDLLLSEKLDITNKSLKIPLSNQLANLGFYKKNKLSLAGLLLLSDKAQQFKPTFSVKCVSFDGTDISVSNFKDREDALQGNLVSLYKQCLSFLKRNLRKVQIDKSFNSRPRLEIPEETLEELVVNALIHRNYFIQAYVKVFIFDDRVEIISPGSLPNTLTVENIRSGISGREYQSLEIPSFTAMPPIFYHLLVLAAVFQEL